MPFATSSFLLLVAMHLLLIRSSFGVCGRSWLLPEVQLEVQHLKRIIFGGRHCLKHGRSTQETVLANLSFGPSLWRTKAGSTTQASISNQDFATPRTSFLYNRNKNAIRNKCIATFVTSALLVAVSYTHLTLPTKLEV